MALIYFLDLFESFHVPNADGFIVWNWVNVSFFVMGGNGLHPVVVSDERGQELTVEGIPNFYRFVPRAWSDLDKTRLFTNNLQTIYHVLVAS